MAGFLPESYEAAYFGDIGLGLCMADETARVRQRAAFEITVNGEARRVDVDLRTTLLDLLRETLGLGGTKKGCDHGQCGACTVLVDGVRINSCLSLAVMHEGQSVTTIEGVGLPPNLSPLQRAFLDRDAFQCG